MRFGVSMEDVLASIFPYLIYGMHYKYAGRYYL